MSSLISEDWKKKDIHHLSTSGSGGFEKRRISTIQKRFISKTNQGKKGGRDYKEFLTRPVCYIICSVTTNTNQRYKMGICAEQHKPRVPSSVILSLSLSPNRRRQRGKDPKRGDREHKKSVYRS